MKDLLWYCKEGAILLGLAMAVVLGLLLFAVFVRPLMILAIISMFGAAILSIFLPGVRTWFENLGAPAPRAH